MPIQPPSRQQLEWIADALHITLTEEELDVFTEAAGPALAGLARLDELPDEQLPVKYAARRPRAPAGRGGEPGQRLGLEVLDPGRGRTGRWRAGRSG